MAANGQPQGGGPLSYSNTDWGSYKHGRPEYPQSLIEMINDYRQQHGNADHDRVVDIGSGNGVALLKFAKYFKAIHYSDPSPANVQEARINLPNYLAETGIAAKIEYSQCMGEEAYKSIGHGVADLVISATAAHFANPDELMSSIAKILRPGGTLAIFSYFFPQFPDQSELFKERFGEASREILRYLRTKSDNTISSHLGRSFMNLSTGEGGLEYLPLPDELFSQKRRVCINSSHGEMKFGDELLAAALLPGEKPGNSRILESDKIIRLNTGVDASAKGWDQQIDRAFLLAFFDSMRPAAGPMPDEDFESILSGFKQVLDTECATGEIRVIWPSQLVLATRK